GEEPYTIAMCLSEFSKIITYLDFGILGTDLSTRILKTADHAVYTQKQAVDIPPHLKNKYLLKDRDPKEGKVKIVPELQSKVYFKRLNFMDKYYPIQGRFDVVFCRNVLIYFERHIQEQVIHKICNFIPTGGYLFLGHSESILGMNVPLKQIRPTVYKKI
ncbi:MAG: chemotaxis protein CheR, partial [Candidatus Heimdallarchaeota archaeon]|nr:chemotaxis protein CheR [Candidatus Heimdallarchaeota archaeon]